MKKPFIFNFEVKDLDKKIGWITIENPDDKNLQKETTFKDSKCIDKHIIEICMNKTKKKTKKFYEEEQIFSYGGDDEKTVWEIKFDKNLKDAPRSIFLESKDEKYPDYNVSIYVDELARKRDVDGIHRMIDRFREKNEENDNQKGFFFLIVFFVAVGAFVIMLSVDCSIQKYKNNKGINSEMEPYIFKNLIPAYDIIDLQKEDSEIYRELKSIRTKIEKQQSELQSSSKLILQLKEKIVKLEEKSKPSTENCYIMGKNDFEKVRTFNRCSYNPGLFTSPQCYYKTSEGSFSKAYSERDCLSG